MIIPILNITSTRVILKWRKFKSTAAPPQAPWNLFTPAGTLVMWPWPARITNRLSLTKSFSQLQALSSTESDLPARAQIFWLDHETARNKQCWPPGNRLGRTWLPWAIMQNMIFDSVRKEEWILKVIDSILIKIFWNMQFESKRLVVRAPRCVVQLYIFSNYIHTCAVHTCQQLISRLELFLTWRSTWDPDPLYKCMYMYIYLVQRHTGYICLSDIFKGVWNVYKRCQWCVQWGDLLAAIGDNPPPHPYPNPLQP